MRTRLAPTPSGYLHLGNILSFSITVTLARQAGAAVLLRIDDLDQGRVRPASITDVFQSLTYLGITWNEGPADASQFVKQFSQLKRLPLYEKALLQLRDLKMVYACDCSRKTFATCRCRSRKLSLDALHHQWRIITDGATVDPSLKDFVVRRKDGFPAYQLSSVVDDNHFDIGLVVRGEDLRASTQAQVFLSGLLDAPALKHTKWLHHHLLLEPNGDKMSKSAGAESVHYLAAHGYKPPKIFSIIARKAGLDTAIANAPDLGEAYTRKFELS